MNVQAHMSGQISGQVPNQAGNQLPVLPQQNGNLPTQMQNLGGPPRTFNNMDPDCLRARTLMRERIYDILMQRRQQPINDANGKKFLDIVKRLEEGLFKNAESKEDYMNMDTLESRLHNLIKRPSLNNQNQHYPQHVNSPSTIGTMIPTPGMSHSGNSNMMVTSSVDTSMIATSGCSTIAHNTVNTGSLLPTGGLHGGSFSRSDGHMSNGYQQSPASFSVGSGGNMSSMGVQRITSQMIPTPGFNSNTNQSCMNLDSSSNGGGLSTAESTMVSQPQQQKQHIGGQNSRILHSLGSQVGSGIRSGLHQKPYGFSNGALNGGLGLISSNLPLVNEPGTSEGYLTTTPYVNSPKPLHQHFDQHQRPAMHGDAYGMNNTDSFGPGNYYGAATSVGSMMNTQTLNSVSVPSISKTTSLISNQSNMHSTQQAAHIKPQPIDQSEKMSFQASLPSRDNLLNSHQQQQFQQQPHQFQQQQFVQHQHQLKQQNQHTQQHLLNNDAFGQSHLTSDLSSQVKREPGVEHHNEVMHSQAPEQYQLSEMQNQFQQNWF